jgi:phi13 family phage major tail protein
MGYPIGLRDLHFAPEEAGGTYGTPVKLSEAVTANVTPNYNITTLYGDDRAVAVAKAMGDIDIEISVTDLKSDDYDLLMGTVKNADGAILDNADDVAPYGALLFRLPLEDGGFRYYCYYKGKFQPPGNNHNTKGSEVQFQNSTITGKFMSRENGDWRARLDSVDDTDGSVAASWFTSVYEPTPVI